MRIPKPAALALTLAFIGIISINVALVLQNRTLKGEISAPPPWLPQVGTKIDQLAGVGLDGRRLELPFGTQQQRTLLFVFSTRCAVCNLNWPQWQSIAHSLQREPLRLVFANIESPIDGGYAKLYGIDRDTVFAQLDPAYQAALNLRLTPLTILLAPCGEVVHVWPGPLSNDETNDLLRGLKQKMKGGELHD